MESPFTERDREALALILTQQEDQAKVLDALVAAVSALRAASPEAAQPKKSKWMDWLKVGIVSAAVVADKTVKNPDNRAIMGTAKTEALTAIDLIDHMEIGAKRETP